MAQQAQQQSGNDSGMGPVWVIVALFLAIYIIWYVGHAQIVRLLFSINLAQAELIRFVLGPNVLANETYQMQTIDPSSVTWAQLVDYIAAVGTYARYPMVLLLAVLAVVLYRSDVTRRFHRTYDMKLLRAQEESNWPCIMPIIKSDLAKTDINTGPWAMALNPLEFARKYQLLKKDDPLLDTTSGQEMTAGIRRVDAKRIFTLQLGAAFEGFDRCSLPARALAAVFMARMNRDRQSATMILTSLDKSTVQGKPDYSVAMATLNKYRSTELVQDIVNQHAYVLTVLASLLQASREDGVVPSAEFLWLKTMDRRLWYMLNCVGRQTPYVEVAGPFAHWKAELTMGRRSLVPMIDEAIKALEIAVKEVKLSSKELGALLP